jgi:tetratricopeptide (TPR) repeat protein
VAVSAVALLSLLVGGWWSSLELGKAAQRERRHRALADEHFGRSLEAVDQLLAEVAAADLASVPHMELRRRQLLLKAVGFYQDFLAQRGDDPTVRRHAGRVYSRLGDIREMLNEDAEALTAYRQAVELLEEPGGDDLAEAARRRELARVYNNLGILRKKQGATREAERSLRQALELRRQLRDEVPDDPDSRRELADSHYHLAALLARLEDFKQAEAGYQEALAVQNELVREVPQRPEYRRDLARTWNNLGILYWTRGRDKEARSAFEQALEQRAELVKAFPDEPLYRWDLARAHNNQAGRLLKKQPRQAERAYRGARDLLAGLVEDFPRAPRYRRELAAVLTNLGNLQRQLRRPKEALASVRHALQLRAALVEKFPNVPDYRHELAGTELELGTLFHVRRPEQAETAYRRALAQLRPLVADHPAVPSYRADLVLALDNLAHLLLRRGRLGEPAQGVSLLVPGPSAGPLHRLVVLARGRAALVEAGLCLDEAINYQKKQGGSGPSARSDLARLHWMLAGVRVRLGQHAQAAAAARQLPVLVRDQNHYLGAAQLLARCVLLAEQDLDLAAPEREERAGEYARLGVDLLREASAHGLLEDGKKLQGPAYAPLRRRPEFQELAKAGARGR